VQSKSFPVEKLSAVAVATAANGGGSGVYTLRLYNTCPLIDIIAKEVATFTRKCNNRTLAIFTPMVTYSIAIFSLMVTYFILPAHAHGQSFALIS